MESLARIAATVVEGDEDEVVRLVLEAADAAIPPEQIVDQGLLAGMTQIGALWRKDEVFIPEVLLASRAVDAGMQALKPYLHGRTLAKTGAVVLGTVKGDLHSIGKNLVKILLTASGFEVTDLGEDVDSARFLQAIRETRAPILAMSSLLTTTMGEMGATIRAVRDAGLRDSVKIIVGGACVTAKFAEEIGADGYGEDANSAVRICREFVGSA
jgi:5-methyltetrahydrofolate--homocysteine methyltransferase